MKRLTSSKANKSKLYNKLGHIRKTTVSYKNLALSENCYLYLFPDLNHTQTR